MKRVWIHLLGLSHIQQDIYYGLLWKRENLMWERCIAYQQTRQLAGGDGSEYFEKYA